MSNFLKFSLKMTFVFSIIFTSQQSHAALNKPRILFMTSSYGVMLGSVAGFASLAFYESPGAHTRNVALGASLGLYSGILLGVYMIYLKEDPNARPEPEEEEEDARMKLHSPATYSYVPNKVPSKNSILLFPHIGTDSLGTIPTFGIAAKF